MQIPTEEPNLMLVDYMNWALSRAYTKGEMRYFEFLKETKRLDYLQNMYKTQKKYTFLKID